MANERTTLKRACDRHLAGLPTGSPVWFFKVHGGILQRVGVSDYLGCVAGRFVAIELKHPTETTSKLSRIQRKTMQLIRKAGGLTFTVRTKDEFASAIAETLRLETS